MLIRSTSFCVNNYRALTKTLCFRAEISRSSFQARNTSVLGFDNRLSCMKKPCKPSIIPYKVSLRHASFGQNNTESRFLFTWKYFFVALGFMGSFSTLMYFVRKRNEKVQEEGTYGKMLIGGDWTLTSMDNKPISSDDFKGEWHFLYFGFCNCPDICPDELEKVCKVMDELPKQAKMPKMKTIFITVDPWRDTPDVMKSYCSEFHKDLIGVTGSVEDVTLAARKYRIYVSKGPVDEDGDYIVDHSILTYLINPEGETEHFYSNTKDREYMLEDIPKRIAKYNAQHRKLFGIF